MVIGSYSYAGVPHLKGDRAYNKSLASIAQSTQKNGASRFGGFSALFDIQKFKLKHPLIVATTDGVGTKLELANLQKKHDTIGQDLVAMCVNDLITCGARPIFFLDYFATGKFDKKKTVQVIKSIGDGCLQAGCSLIGGETAVMPDFYDDSKYDLAGFSVGLVDQSKVIDGRNVKEGHILLGISSSEFHSNGYSLLRKVFTKEELAGKIGRKLLTPTRIYVRPILEITSKIPVHAIAHITGGGFYDNLPRVLPKKLGAKIIRNSWPIDNLFKEVQKRASYSDDQMYHTFNMGIGMALVIDRSDVKAAQNILDKQKLDSWIIGTVKKGSGVVIQ